MFLSPFLRSNGFTVILWAAFARTRQVVMYAAFSMSLCCISIKRLKILLEGTDGPQSSYNESNASQFVSMKRRYVGILNALSMVSENWTTASWIEVDKLSVDSSSLVSFKRKWLLVIRRLKAGLSHIQKNRGSTSAMCYSLNYYLASDSFIPHGVCD